MKFVLFIAFISGAIHAQDMKCESAREFKDLVIAANYADVAKKINFPVQGTLYGSPIEVVDAVILEKFSQEIFSDDVISIMNNASDCELASILNIGEDYKVNSLAVGIDKEDLRYSSSGITSEKKLHKIIDDANNNIKSGNFHALSQLFRYPFYIKSKNTKVKIKNKDDFLAYKSDIINNEFLELLAHVSKTRDFIPTTNGLMLNKRGDYWIVQFEDRLYFQPVEPFYK